jgi:hypothetical protein
MNEQNKILLKLAEELSELTTRVLQQVNKKKNYSTKIDQEIKDIEKQLKFLKEINE